MMQLSIVHYWKYIIKMHFITLSHETIPFYQIIDSSKQS